MHFWSLENQPTDLYAVDILHNVDGSLMARMVALSMIH